MTIRELYDICDQMNVITKCFIINSDSDVIAWNTPYVVIHESVDDFQIEHYRFIADDEVIIWVV